MLKDINNKLTTNFIKLSIGNILEWYDFTLYGLFALELSKAFFSDHSRGVALLMVFMTFAVGFLARPIGAAIFGIIGDTSGRRYAVNLSIWFMVVPTILIGCIPNYAQIGIFAPILLLILRIMQGLSAGGQFSGLIIVANDNNTKYRSFLVSLVYSISVVGSLIAALVGYLSIATTQLIGNSFLIAENWRIPFLLSSVIFLIYYRLNRQHYHLPAKKPCTFKLQEIIKLQPLAIINLIIFAAANGAVYYILFTYLVTYLEVHLKINQNLAFMIENGILLLSIILYPWFGYKAVAKHSKINSATKNVIWMIIAIPFFYLSNYSLWWSFIGLTILVINECALTSYMISWYAGVFDNRYRMTAFSIAFNIGATISGFAPLTAEYLSKFSQFTILWLLIILFIIILLSLLSLASTIVEINSNY